MANFKQTEFRRLYSILLVFSRSSWNIGPGRRSNLKPMDVLFIYLTVLRNGGSRDMLGAILCIKGLNFMELTTGFISKIIPFCLKIQSPSMKTRWEWFIVTRKKFVQKSHQCIGSCQPDLSIIQLSCWDRPRREKYFPEQTSWMATKLRLPFDPMVLRLQLVHIIDAVYLILWPCTIVLRSRMEGWESTMMRKLGRFLNSIDE